MPARRVALGVLHNSSSMDEGPYTLWCRRHRKRNTGWCSTAGIVRTSVTRRDCATHIAEGMVVATMPGKIARCEKRPRA